LRTHLGPQRLLTRGIVGKKVEEVPRRQILTESVDASGKEKLLDLGKGGTLSLPDSRKIDFATETRRRREQIRFAVSCTGNSRIVVHGPLSIDVNRHR